MWSKIKVWKRLRAYCSHCCPNNHGVVSLQAMVSCVSPIQAFKNLDGQNLIAWSSLSEALDLQCLIFKWGDMPLKKFVDLGHLDSHCHPVANACTTEMQVTSFVSRPSTPPCCSFKAMTQTLQFSLITQSPFNTFDFDQPESTSLRTTLNSPPSIVMREEQ